MGIPDLDGCWQSVEIPGEFKIPGRGSAGRRGEGDDTLFGVNAHNVLFRGSGDDSALGESGRDTLAGDTGNNDQSSEDIIVTDDPGEIDAAFDFDQLPASVDHV
jgi:Ca2+-binding RTX toxin-like protein